MLTSRCYVFFVRRGTSDCVLDYGTVEVSTKEKERRSRSSTVGLVLLASNDDGEAKDCRGRKVSS